MQRSQRLSADTPPVRSSDRGERDPAAGIARTIQIVGGCRNIERKGPRVGDGALAGAAIKVPSQFRGEIGPMRGNAARYP